MQKYLMSFVLLLLTVAAYAQNPPGSGFQDKSDPEAKVILDKVKSTYDSYKSLEISFKLAIEVPEEPKEEQNGNMKQLGDKFKLELSDLAIYCNGEFVWTHIKKNKQVQINDFEEVEDSEEFLSPQDLLKAYESGDYYYVLMNESYEGKTPIQQVEFKPKDPDSEYSKMRVTINKKTSQIMRLKIFSRDGTRYTLTINNTKPNQDFATSTFVLDTKTLEKDVKIEDLRL